MLTPPLGAFVVSPLKSVRRPEEAPPEAAEALLE
jgi:hypothetical protein